MQVKGGIQVKIACIGNIAYDCTVSGKSFLSEGVRNSFDNCKFSTGGPTSNSASVISKYGDQVDFYGQVGNDTNGRYVLDEMKKEKIDLRHVNISNNVMTPFSFVIINEEKNTRTICSLRSPVDFKDAKIEKVKFEKDYSFILTDGKYPKDALKLMSANPQAISIIDAGRVNDGVISLCKKVNYIICSEDFANEITGMCLNDDYDYDCLVFNKMKSLFPQANIAITIGSKGYIYEENERIFIKPAYNSGAKTIDTNCAGDIFHGAFTHALASGFNYSKSLEFANIAASISTTRRGGRTSTPELDEVMEIVKNEMGALC